MCITSSPTPAKHRSHPRRLQRAHARAAARICEGLTLSLTPTLPLPRTLTLIPTLCLTRAGRMREGRNLAIVPGGLEDATMFVHGVHQTAMKRRLGLVKYALQHGYALQPIYTFGEPHTYYTYCGMQRLRLWLNQLQVRRAYFVA